MNITELRWIETDYGMEWQGSGNGIWSTVKFTISAAAGSENNFVITTNMKQIQTTVCSSLEAAKTAAQSMLNGYALLQAIL